MRNGGSGRPLNFIVRPLHTVELERLRRVVASKNRVDLERMLKNANAENARDHAAIIKDELDSRFPGWDQPSKRGAKPTKAHFRGVSKLFPTTKDAYLWLVERFFAERPDLVTKSPLGGRYFARTIAELFPTKPEPHQYARLPNGWFANVVLNNAQKFDVLARLARAGGFAWRDEWDLEVLDPTEQLQARKQLEKIIKNISLEGL